MNPKSEKLIKERGDNELKIAECEAKLNQKNHQLRRAEKRKKYLSKAEQDHQTHHLCNLAGAMEHYFPITKQMDGVDPMLLMEKLAELPPLPTKPGKTCSASITESTATTPTIAA